MSGTLRIGLIGWGTVGSALGLLIAQGPVRVQLVALAVRDPSRGRATPLPAGVPLMSPPELIREAEIVVEVVGGVDAALDWARDSLTRGRAYVTANKALLATHGALLAELATGHGGALLASASVGGGAPMIELVAHLAATGRIERLRGVLNATTTFMLSTMARGNTYAQALQAAQDAGYAEADPTFDVEGRDAAQKLAILASVAWGGWRSESEVERQGIVGIRLEPGATVRLVAEATPERMTVRPMRLPPSSPLAGVSGVASGLVVELTDTDPHLLVGPGAGGRATAGALYADLARLSAGERPILFAPRHGAIG
ncbi:MAG: homoserine dehydrogenase [Candidatus Limnocylindria bacterium]